MKSNSNLLLLRSETRTTGYLAVDDQDTLNKPGADGGTRNDASRGYNEDPVRFQIGAIMQ